MNSSENEFVVNIFDRYGKMVYTKLTKELELQIDVSSYVSGNYVITVSKDGKQASSIFVKK